MQKGAEALEEPQPPSGSAKEGTRKRKNPDPNTSATTKKKCPTNKNTQNNQPLSASSANVTAICNNFVPITSTTVANTSTPTTSHSNR